MRINKILVLINLIFISSFIFTSCGLFDIDKQKLQDKLIPDEARPSEEMTYSNLQNESYSEHAVKYIINDYDSPYESIELFGDGTFVIAKEGASSRPQLMKAIVRSTDEGLKVSIPKQKNIATRSDNDYYIVGGYIMEEEGHYTLKDFGSLKIDENNNEVNLTFENTFGNRICTVFANKETTINDIASKSLCRTWNVESLEQWIYLGVMQILNLKYIGGDNPHFEGTGVNNMDKETLEEMINASCKKVTFSPSGSYYCVYNNGEVLYSTWMWINEEEGTLFYDWQAGENEEGYVTARFSEDKCLIYEDYTIDISEMIEDGDLEDEELESEEFLDITEILNSSDTKLRYLILNTLTAVK